MRPLSLIMFVMRQRHFANLTWVASAFALSVSERRAEAVSRDMFVSHSTQERAYGVCVHHPGLAQPRKQIGFSFCSRTALHEFYDVFRDWDYESHSHLYALIRDRQKIASVQAINDCGNRQISGSRFLDMLAPPFHHGASSVYVICPIIRATYLVLIDVSKRNLDQLRVPAVLVEDGAGH